MSVNHITGITDNQEVNQNRTIGTILQSAYGTSYSNFMTSKYICDNKWKSLANKKNWYNGNVPRFHNTYVNDGLAPEITDTFATLMFGNKTSVLSGDVKIGNLETFYKIAVFASIYGECAIKANVRTEENVVKKVDIVPVEPLDIVDWTEDVFEHIIEIKKIEKVEYAITERRSINESGNLIIEKLQYEKGNNSFALLEEPIVTNQKNLLVSKVINNPYGRSDYTNIIDLLALTAFYTTTPAEELRVAKLKIFADATMFSRSESLAGQSNVTTDLDSSVFYQGKFRGEDKHITHITGDTHGLETQELCDATKSKILNQVGLNVITLMSNSKTDTGRRVIEIETALSTTISKINQKRNYIEIALRILLDQLTKETNVSLEKLVLDFDTSQFDMMSAKLENISKMEQSKSISTSNRVKMLNPDLEEEELKEETLRVKFENSIPMTAEEQAQLMSGEDN